MAQICLKVVAVCIALAIVQMCGVYAAEMANLNVLNKLLHTSEAMQRNPALSAQCFGIYQPQLTAITNTYEKEREICRGAAQNAKDAIENEVASSYAEVHQLGTNICGTYSKCTEDRSDSYAFFDCNNAASSAAITLSYNVQTVSKDKMQYISAKFEVITYDLNTCNDKCSDKYVREHARVFEELQACLNGKDVSGTTTTRATTTESTTRTTPTSPTTTTASTTTVTTTTPRTTPTEETSERTTPTTPSSSSTTGFPTPPTIIDEYMKFSQTSILKD